MAKFRTSDLAVFFGALLKLIVVFILSRRARGSLESRRRVEKQQTSSNRAFFCHEAAFDGPETKIEESSQQV